MNPDHRDNIETSMRLLDRLLEKFHDETDEYLTASIIKSHLENILAKKT